MNPNAFLSKYERLLPFYKKLVDEVKYVIKVKLKKHNIKIAKISGRVKTTNSFEEKTQRKEYKDPLKDVSDLAGVRIVCYYESDLKSIEALIRSEFIVHERVDKTEILGIDKMGYHGIHFTITLGSGFAGVRYDGITNMKCEIQVRTVLQDAWASISHHLIYKEEASIPGRIKRDLNNVASLLEIAQGVFDSVRHKRNQYEVEIESSEEDVPAFLSNPIDYDTLAAYTRWKYPDLPISENWHARLLADLNREKYQKLRDIDIIVKRAKKAVDAYRNENPSWFQYGTDYLTKSFGFVDQEFREKHPFGKLTIEAFKRLEYLVKKPRTATK